MLAGENGRVKYVAPGWGFVDVRGRGCYPADHSVTVTLVGQWGCYPPHITGTTLRRTLSATLNIIPPSKDLLQQKYFCSSFLLNYF